MALKPTLLFTKLEVEEIQMSEDEEMIYMTGDFEEFGLRLLRYKKETYTKYSTYYNTSKSNIDALSQIIVVLNECKRRISYFEEELKNPTESISIEQIEKRLKNATRDMQNNQISEAHKSEINDILDDAYNYDPSSIEEVYYLIEERIIKLFNHQYLRHVGDGIEEVVGLILSRGHKNISIIEEFDEVLHGNWLKNDVIKSPYMIHQESVTEYWESEKENLQKEYNSAHSKSKAIIEWLKKEKPNQAIYPSPRTIKRWVKLD
jgi:hypothetical protein